MTHENHTVLTHSVRLPSEDGGGQARVVRDAGGSGRCVAALLNEARPVAEGVELLLKQRLVTVSFRDVRATP